VLAYWPSTSHWVLRHAQLPDEGELAAQLAWRAHQIDSNNHP